MRIPLWEWAITQDARNNPVGVSMTEHGAMTALSRALIKTGRPAQGTVAPLDLVDAITTEDYYDRYPPIRNAEYAHGVIRWT
jgi:hypothetical protein